MPFQAVKPILHYCGGCQICCDKMNGRIRRYGLSCTTSLKNKVKEGSASVLTVNPIPVQQAKKGEQLWQQPRSWSRILVGPGPLFSIRNSSAAQQGTVVSMTTISDRSRASNFTWQNYKILSVYYKIAQN
jgi:hypothetical protein